MTDRLEQAYSPHFYVQFADQLCAAQKNTMDLSIYFGVYLLQKVTLAMYMYSS